MRKTSILFTLCFFLLSIVGLRAQDNQVPLDPGVRTGVLSNGLTYYILPNKKPEQKVELRLAVNAGSILENDNQQGLAHFLEHMAFNGTENFKKNELVDYLQSAGVKFGAHLNAYTSFDETVYMLALPTDNAEVLEKGFQILEDWAHNLLLDSAEIEKERGVVLEEYRLGLGASKRMLAKYLPKTLYQSQYVDRLPIGKKEILENFDRATILEFYQKWYRPDLMAVIVVGDINVDEIEAKIKSHFGGIKNPPNAAPRNIINVPDHEETFAAFATDAEATYGSVQFVQKQPGTFTKKGTEEEALESLKWSLMFFVLNQRYQELAQKPGSPFSYAYGYKGGMWARNKEAVQGFSVVAGGKYKEALEVMMLEMERLKRYGITENELKRAHMDYASYYEKQLKEKDKTESRSHAGNLVAYFLENESFESEEWALNFYNTHKDRIAIAELNTMFASVFYNENRVVVMTGPDSDKDKMPSEAEVLQILENIQVMEIEAYEENILPDQLFSLQPTSGSVVSTSKPSKVGSTTLTLSNGMKIIYKTTTLKNDEILFNARSKGGTYLYDDKMYKTISNGLGVLSNCGVGQFSESDLSKMLAGKNVNVSPYVGSSTEGMSGNCAPKDMETMMQLIHMFFVQPRKEQEAFDAYVNRQRAFYDNMAADPGQFFNISWNSFMYNNHPRMFTIPTDADWNNLSYDLIYEIYKERFANAADFTFVFVGNIEVEAFKTMAEKYLASLPGNKSRESVKDIGLRYATGTKHHEVHKGSEPKSRVSIMYSGMRKYKAKDDLHLDLLGDVLSIKLTEVLREEMSGVYGSSAYGYMSRLPVDQYRFMVSFPCGPENVDTLIAAALKQVDILINEGPTEKDLDKAKKTALNTMQSNIQSNRYWLNLLQDADFYGDKAGTVEQRIAAIEKIKAKDLKKAAKKYVSGDYLIGVLYPDEE